MAGHRPEHSSPANLDIRDPEFPAKYMAWQFQQQCDIRELIARTRETLAVSRTLMQEVDRMLGWR